MEEIFITNIQIEKVRNLENFDIELSQAEKKHIILTGKNGSGKTSLLEAISSCISDESKGMEKGIKILTNLTNEIKSPNFLRLYMPARRSLNIKQPSTITSTADIQEKINKENKIEADTSEYFLQRMANMNYEKFLAEKDNDIEETKRIDMWFSKFTKLLRDIYKCEALELKPERKSPKFKIQLPDREPFGLNEMSDGYSAILRIVMELINLMEAKSGKYCDYTMPGIVLIDEIETHLHIELQKGILPFLTEIFPHIQFIVSTHSPFVLSSIKNAVVFDLEKKTRIEDLSKYSLEAIVESYFDIDMYSEDIKKTFEIYKELCFKERTEEENYKFLEAKSRLELVPPAATELYSAFNELESKRKAAKNGQDR